MFSVFLYAVQKLCETELGVFIKLAFAVLHVHATHVVALEFVSNDNKRGAAVYLCSLTYVRPSLCRH